jgi:acetyltransferase-like isoleucine patch superfamily enzyme
VNSDRTLPWDWFSGRVPDNVTVHPEAYLETTYSFQMCRSAEAEAVRIGHGSSIYLGVMFDLGKQARVSIGNYVLMNGARIICDREITIGDYSLISWNVVLMDTPRFPMDPEGRRIALRQAPAQSPRHIVANVPAKPIGIGANVWIGFDCCVLPGVTIGDGAVIGARSVVVTDVPPFSVAVGNPARVIRQLEPCALPRDNAHSDDPAV